MTIETLIETTFHTADADARLQAADAAFLTVFLSLKGEARAARWRGLDSGAKFRLVVRQIEQLGMSWEPSVVEAQIAKYDTRYAAGPVEAAIEGALERLAFDNAQRAETADKADRAFFRRNATSYTNALDQYRRGVRPQILASGARLVPSSQPGRPAHLVTMDGDWICSCQARASMHWPLALCIGIEQAFEDMQQYDDGACDPPGDNPMGDEPGDELPDSRWSLPGYGAPLLRCGLPNPLYRVQEHERTLGQRIAEARRATYDYAA